MHPFPVPGHSSVVAGEAVLGLLPDFLKMVSVNEGIVSISNTIQDLAMKLILLSIKFWPKVRKISGENIVKGTENICLQVRRKNLIPSQGLCVENTSQSCAPANAIRTVTDYLVVHSCVFQLHQ